MVMIKVFEVQEEEKVIINTDMIISIEKDEDNDIKIILRNDRYYFIKLEDFKKIIEKGWLVVYEM